MRTDAAEDTQALVLRKTIGGATALMKAAEANDIASVEYLVKVGSNVHEVDNMKRTARECAKMNLKPD